MEYKYMFTEEYDENEEKINNKAAEIASRIEIRNILQNEQERAINVKAKELTDMIDAYKLAYGSTEWFGNIGSEISELVALMDQHKDRLRKEDGLELKDKDEWFEKIMELVFEYLSLEDHLCNAGRHDEIKDEIMNIMEGCIMKSYFNEGILPEAIAALSTKEFVAMKKKTLA